MHERPTTPPGGQNGPEDKKGMLKTAIGGALAAFGVGAVTSSDMMQPPRMEFAHERVSNMNTAAAALYEATESEEQRTGGISEMGEIERLRAAALDQFLGEHPGLREEIIERWGSEPFSAASNTIYVTRTRDGREPSFKGSTVFGVYVENGGPMYLFDLGVTVSNGEARLTVKQPIDTLSHFFPGEPVAGAHNVEGETVSTTAEVIRVTEPRTLPDGGFAITSTIRFPDGKTAEFDEEYAAGYVGTPTTDYAVGETIPFVEYQERDGKRVVVNRTYPHG